jgi:hypothetical protein
MITQITTMTEIKYKDITEKIMGAFFEAYKFLGNAYLPARQGFQEAIYPMQDYPLPGKLNRRFFTQAKGQLLQSSYRYKLSAVRTAFGVNV